MYNESIKKRYIDLNPNNNLHFHRVMTNYFDRAEDSEKRYGKDLSQFTSAEIMGMYKSFCTPSLSMLVVINNQFQNYTSWYMKEIANKDNQNHYREMRDEILMQCISLTSYNRNIVSRKQLLELIKNFQNPYEQFLYLGLFEGIRGEQMSDFFELRISDFDKKKKTVRLPNREIPISNELIHYAEESSDTYQMYNIDGEPVTRGKLHEEDDRIIKCPKSVGFETSHYERTQLLYRIMRKTKRYDFVPKSLSITMLLESGRIELVKRKMKEQNQDSVEATIRSNWELIELIYGRIVSIPKWLLKYEMYSKD